MSIESGRDPAFRSSAFAGVLDPRRTEWGEHLRGRLEKALEPDGAARRLDDGCLSLAWTEGVACGKTGDSGILALLDGRLYNGSELAPLFGLPEETDAATLLAHGYAALGAELLPLLRGDFALLLWDSAARAGLIARDQLGGRPLFLHRQADGMAFASETRNLTRLLPRAPQPDTDMVARWFFPGLAPPGRSLFEGVEPLAPATCLSFQNGAVAAHRYWEPRYRERRVASEEAEAEVLAALTEAVRRRVGSAGETAVLLSGGIDSGSVAGIAAAGLDGRAGLRRAYSVALPGHPELDEEPLIRAVNTHFGLRGTALRLDSGGLLSGALPFLESWELPPITTTLFFLYPLLRRAASDGVRVLLDGEGGDAVFWHPPGLLGDRLRHGRLFSAWRLAGRLPEPSRPSSRRARAGLLRREAKRGDRRVAVPAWLAVRDPAVAEATVSPPRWQGPAWWAAQVDGVLGLGSEMMHDLSRRHAALSGIEPRHPLLDVDLIELVLSLPPELAFDRRYNRPLLRHAVGGLVPDQVRLRPYKSHFDPVLIAGLRTDLPVIEALLLPPGAETGAYVDRRGLEAHLASPPSGAEALREWSKTLWFLTTMECWLRQQAGRELLPAELGKRIAEPDFTFLEL